jgi:peptidoglycan/xylan/chitin deacetylase (PgdA/CDA1 family)
MWEAELDVLHAAGWSMVSHTMGHPGLDTLSVGEVDYQLRASQQWLIARGYRGSNVFIAPYHAYGPSERAATALYYTAARGASYNPPNDSLVSWMPDLPFELTGIEAEFLPYTTALGRQELRDLLQRTADEGAFVDVFFHQVMPTDTAAFRLTLEVLDDFRDRVLPYHELYPAFARGVF